MMKTKMWNIIVSEKGSIANLRIFSYISMVAVTIFMLLGGVVVAQLLGGKYGHLGSFEVGGFIAAMGMILIIILRQDELSATAVIAVSLYVDWYLGFFVLSIVMAILLLWIFFLARSPERPWTEPRPLWLWLLFLGLTIFPAIRGAITVYDAFYYYPDLIFGALIMFWLGTIIARDVTSISKFFQMLAIFGVLIALHIIIQSITGKFLFITTTAQSYLNSVSDYQLGSTGVTCLASFFIQPDAGSAFLAMIFFIPLGLFVECSSLFKKVLYLMQAICIVIALLLTYSTGAWLSLVIGLIVFILLTGSKAYSIIMIICVFLFSILLYFIFQQQVLLLMQHASAPNELLLRQGLWQTAWRVILAFPLTGIGLGRELYLKNAEPYRVLSQYEPFNNPHNSYMELGAMAGIPTLLVFIALIVSAIWLALCHWQQVSGRKRSLFGAGIASIIVLSINSWSFGAWTLPPLAACGWMILGAISSPLLSRRLDHQAAKEQILRHVCQKGTISI